MEIRTGPVLMMRLMLLLALSMVLSSAMAQNRKELEKRREALDKQIRTTTVLIEQARQEPRVTQEKLKLLGSQIAARNALIQTMNGELGEVDRRIAENEEMVRSLTDDLAALREEYGRMLHFAYRNRSAYDRMSYLFAAADFQQAWKRSRFLDQIARQRRRQAVLIEEMRADMEVRSAALRGQREEKSRLLCAGAICVAFTCSVLCSM